MAWCLSLNSRLSNISTLAPVRPLVESGHKVSWWRHQMETISALLAICAGNSPVPVNSPHKGQWRGALMFSLIYARINNREAGDLRRHPTHCDVMVMYGTDSIKGPTQARGTPRPKARFMWPTWGPPRFCRPQVGPMLAHELCYQGPVGLHWHPISWITLGWTITNWHFSDITAMSWVCWYS